MKFNKTLAFFSLFILNQSLSAVTVQDLKESGKQAKAFVEEKYNDTKNWVSENKGKSAVAATLFVSMLVYILKLKSDQKLKRENLLYNLNEAISDSEKDNLDLESFNSKLRLRPDELNKFKKIFYNLFAKELKELV